MHLKNKVIVVTGAGSGIGREVALQLLSHGSVVAAIDFNEETLDETLRLADHPNISCHVADVSNAQEVLSICNDVLEVHGVVDGLVNNAGIMQPFYSVEGLGVDDLQRIFNVNFWGVMYMLKAFMPHLRKRPEAHIINISSMGGYMPFPGQVGYGASKAAVKLLTEGLAVELSSTDIGVSVAYPGAVNTSITHDLPDISPQMRQIAERAGLSPKTAARRIIRGIESNQPRILIGYDSLVIDKLYRLMPVSTSRFISWIMSKHPSFGG